MKKRSEKEISDQRIEFGSILFFIIGTLVILVMLILSEKGTSDYGSSNTGLLYFIILGIFLGIFKRLNPWQIIYNLQVKKFQGDLRYYDFSEVLYLIWFISCLILVYIVDFASLRQHGFKVGIVALIPLLRIIWAVITGRSAKE